MSNRRVCDLSQDDIFVGLKIRSLKDPNKIGVVTKIDYNDDNYAWVLWNGDEFSTSGFYGTDCKCEVVD